MDCPEGTGSEQRKSMTEIFSSFQTVIEKQLEADFLATGYVIRGVEDQNALDGIRAMIVDNCSAYLGDPAPASVQEYLDNISSKLEVDHLNALRLDLLSGMQNAFRLTKWLAAKFRKGEIRCQT